MKNAAGQWTLTGILIIIAAVIVVIVGVFLCVFSMNVWHIFGQPAERQLLVDDPKLTIDVRKDFHDTIAAIITDDNNILTYSVQMQQYKQEEPKTYLQDPNYSNAMTFYTGAVNIRISDITHYNSLLSNSDTQKWADKQKVQSLDTTPLPLTDATAEKRVLDTEIASLTKYETQVQNADVSN